MHNVGMGPASERRSEAAWFAFVGKGFLSPDAPVLLRMITDLRGRALPEATLELMLGEMEQALDRNPSELRMEFVRLFFDPAGPPCPPFQSVNTSNQLLGPAHRSALAWYHAAGIEPKTTAEPADHIGLLLAFYARILEFETPDVLDAFREEHLTWIPAYCERVILETRHPFYRLLADIVLRLLR